MTALITRSAFATASSTLAPARRPFAAIARLGALGVSEQVSQRLFGLATYAGGAVAMMAFRLLQLGGAILGAGVYLANSSQVRQLTEEAEHIDEELIAGPDEPDGGARAIPADAVS